MFAPKIYTGIPKAMSAATIPAQIPKAPLYPAFSTNAMDPNEIPNPMKPLKEHMSTRAASIRWGYESMQYTKLDTTIPTKPKYSKFKVTAMPAQLHCEGLCAVLP
jgi:hypothetical protein